MTFTVAKEKILEGADGRQKLTLEQFLSLPESDQSYELVNGEVIVKVSPKFFHSRLTSSFWSELSSWVDGIGQVAIE
jgi:Uma2 family endonuclease